MKVSGALTLMDTVEDLPRKRLTAKWLVPATGYLISAVSLVWVFSKFPYAQLGEHLRTMDWRLVLVAIVLELAVYFFDAWRWAALLKPAGAPAYGVCLQSVFVGLFANDVLPARAGELVRCFLLSYETEVPLSLAFASEAILRMMDGIWIVLIYLLVTFQIDTHVAVNRVMWAFGAGVTIFTAVVLLALFRRRHAHKILRNYKWGARLIQFLEEVHRLGNWRQLGMAMLLGGFYWLAQILALWALMGADAFDLGLSAVAFLMIIKSVGTLIPNAPANVGAYQAAMMYGLSLLFVERPNAQIFAEIMFWFLTLPLVVGGAIAIAFTGVDITELHQRARRAHAARE